jgi:hypothetical protein
MKEKLMQLTEESLGMVLEFLKSTKEFAAEQMPLLVQEIYKWLFIKNSAYFLLSIAVFILSIFMLIVLWKIIKEDEHDEFWPMLFMFLASIVALISAIISVNYLLNIIAVFIAPRLYLIHYITDMMK